MREKGMDRDAEETPEILPTCLGRRSYRLKDNPLEFAFALKWSEECKNGLANYMLSSKVNEREPVPLTEQMVANTVIQWLGTQVGQAFLVSVFARSEAEHFLEYMMGDPTIRKRIAKYIKETSW